MKRIISVLFIAVLSAFFAACGNSNPSVDTSSAPKPSSGSSTASPSESTATSISVVDSNKSGTSPDPANNPVDYEAVAAVLNRVLEESGKDEIDRFGHFGNSFAFEDFDSMTLYRTTTLNGYNVIVAYLKDSEEYHVLELEGYGRYTITGIAPVEENPNVIRITAESRTFGGDYIFMNFPAEMFYSLPEGKVTDVRYDSSEGGSVGMVRSNDWQQFGDCSVDEKRTVFTFKMIPGGNGNGYDGPEIITKIAPRYDVERPSVFGFRDTELNLTDDFIAGVRAMEGVASAEFEYIETDLFTGTQLTIAPKPDYMVTCSITNGDVFSVLQDFTVRCVGIRYDEPDFSDALGFRLALPDDSPPMIGAELGGNYTAEVSFQLDKTNIANLHVEEYAGENVDQFLGAWDNFEIQKEVEISGVPVKVGFSVSGPMTAIWEKDGYACNFFMRESEADLAEETFISYVEWCIRDIAIEETES